MPTVETGKPRARRGFAAMTPERRREIARMGGASVPGEKRSFAKDRDLAASAGRKGGEASGGNFAKDPERARQAGCKGGEASGGNFANDRERASEAGRRGGEASRGGGSRGEDEGEGGGDR